MYRKFIVENTHNRRHPSVATEDISSVATEDISSVATEDISSVATEEASERGPTDLGSQGGLNHLGSIFC